MSHNETKVDADNKLNSMLEELDKALWDLFVAVDGLNDKKKQITATYCSLKINFNKMAELKSLIGGESAYENDFLPTAARKELYQESQTFFQGDSIELMKGIQDLALYTKLDSIDKLCRSIDKLLRILYNFFVAGPVIAEHRYIEGIPPKSKLYFFSSPPATERLESLNLEVEQQHPPISPHLHFSTCIDK